MIETNYPMIQAVRVLKEHGVPFVIHAHAYEEHGRTAVAARELGEEGQGTSLRGGSGPPG